MGGGGEGGGNKKNGGKQSLEVDESLRYIHAFMYRNWRFWGPSLVIICTASYVVRKGRLKSSIQSEWLVSETAR